MAVNLFIGLVTQWYPKIREEAHRQWHYILTREMAYTVYNTFSFRCNGVGTMNRTGQLRGHAPSTADPTNKLESVRFRAAIQTPISTPSLLRGMDGERYWRRLRVQHDGWYDEYEYDEEDVMVYHDYRHHQHGHHHYAHRGRTRRDLTRGSAADGGGPSSVLIGATSTALSPHDHHSLDGSQESDDDDSRDSSPTTTTRSRGHSRSPSRASPSRSPMRSPVRGSMAIRGPPSPSRSPSRVIHPLGPGPGAGGGGEGEGRPSRRTGSGRRSPVARVRR